MIAYFIYSSISLALLLFVYRIFLEKEKRFSFNRLFLLWSLVFSFTIPIIPVGIAPLEISWSALFSSGETVSATSYQNLKDLRLDSEVSPTATENNSAAISSETLFGIAFLLCFTISALLLIRLMRIVHRIQLKIRRNSKRYMQDCRVVLLKEKVVPHSFFNTVFLNKKQFEKGEIPEEVLNHEFTHVRQKHSLDILFVEILKAIFWFNPLLYFYKNAIALNHEYLADEAVISKGTIIKNYQRMLLNTMERNALHGLASSFNFSSTKRRLQMMTQSKTKVKFLIKLAMLAPLFAGLSLILGCEPASNENPSDIQLADEISIEILDNNAMLVNEKSMTLDELEGLLSEMPESPELVRMNVSPDAQFGVVTDVQSILKRYEIFKINYSSKKSNDSSDLTLPPAPPEPQAPMEAQNQMLILMNSDGKLLMNEEPVTLNKMRENIKQFVDNSSPNSSEAIVVVKTLPDTPYDQYLELLDEIRSAYSELRNVAAQDRFGTDFSNLEESSSERETIRKMYPMKLSAVPPELEYRKLINSPEVLELKSKMDEALQNLRLKSRVYINIEPTEFNSEDLKASYDEIMESLKNFEDTQSAYYNSISKQTPPLPPIPQKPEDRIKNN
ncbi:MAG: biopolymer transporter ExbD [Gracilimonas sp.]|uniref:M56 family metallopeptidase n=1 Tax=Gracilimonas sp. TaxID=1974203 RepID=UPI0019BC5771|nr:M56 family metallopeptidase [Gracilimonas sp.]MBD3617402.1 biopolymer transporter ExbD [Gracilimonas sp.]